MTRQTFPVLIVARDGEVLADVDAFSTADALAYYLRSRHIDEDATEYTVRVAAGAPGDRDQIARRTEEFSAVSTTGLRVVSEIIAVVKP